MKRHLQPVDSYIPAGKKIRIPFSFCPLCLDTGIVEDDNGEPQDICDCRIGEAVQEAFDNGGPAA